MARSSGGGSRSGGSSGSSHHSSGGGSRSSGSSSRPSSSKTYDSINYRVRHCYIDRKGRRHTYFTDTALDYSTPPNKMYRGAIGFLYLPVLSIILIFFLFALFGQIQGAKKINAYNDSCTVIMDEAGIISSDESQKLETALRQFGNDSGIIPVVYTTNSLKAEDGFDYSDIEAYSMEVYYKLFDDENHLLLVYLNNDDWQWWQIQGDNTYPLLDDSEFTSFQKDVQSGLYSGESIAIAVTNAMDGYGKKISELDLPSVAASIIAPIWLFFPYILIITIILITKHKKYKDEYDYYQKHGLPVAANSIKDICDHCGASNPEKNENCKYCGCSMLKEEN